MADTVTLTYFNTRGLAEKIRLLLCAAGIKVSMKCIFQMYITTEKAYADLECADYNTFARAYK